MDVKNPFLQNLIEIGKEKNIYLEGNVLKLIDKEKLSKEELAYIELAIAKYKEGQGKLFKMQNAAADNETLVDELAKSKKELEIALKDARTEKENAERLRVIAENAKTEVENELTVIHQRAQTELMTSSVKKNYTLLGVVLAISITIYVVLILSKHNDASAFGSTLQNILLLIIGFITHTISQALGHKQSQEDKKT